MKYAVDEIKREVRIVLDNNMTSTVLTGLQDVDTLSIDDLIESKISDAARLIESDAPSYLLDSGEPFSDTIGWKEAIGIGSGWIRLPDDFLRLVSFQMSDWSRPTSKVITDDDPEYAMQSSRYPGIRGCPQKPIVAIVQWPVGLVLEFYSCTQGTNVYVKKARYIPMPKIEDENIVLCEKLKPAIIYYTAYMVAASLQSKDLAESMLNQSKELMK